VKTVVGDPIKVGSVTLIPIMMIKVGFGGGGSAMPGGPTAAALANPAPGIEGFYMSGESPAPGFVAITKKGTRFISVAKARPSEEAIMKTMRKPLLSAALLLLGALIARAQAPLAKPLADFDKLVSQLKISSVVGEAIHVGETAIIPFARIKFDSAAEGR